MKKIDFLGQSPNNFIFQKESNKTTFGGALSALYLLAILSILAYYYVTYVFSLDYEITSYISEEKSLNSDQRKAFLESEKYNPSLLFKFSLLDNINRNLSDRFELYDEITGETIIRDEIIERRVSNVSLIVYYKCFNETNCEIEKKERTPFYQLIIQCGGFFFDLQNETPIELIKNGTFHSNYMVFNADFKMEHQFKWNILRIEESDGFLNLFQKEDEEDNRQ